MEEMLDLEKGGGGGTSIIQRASPRVENSSDEEDGSCCASLVSKREGCSDGFVLTFKDVRYAVEDRRTSIFKRITSAGSKDPKNKIEILKGVTGMAQSGRVIAIMGPSGCGKSTLLDVLAGRMADNSDLNADVRLNGQPASQLLKRVSAYVMQDDALIGSLTVRENLTFAARLRLPQSLSRAEIAKRVDSVIDELGLRKVANTKIGTPFFRGVSGGERRRVSIGMELVTQPHVLFLDEPTSGLDSKSSQKVMETIVTLAKNCRIVICTIHQPSSRIMQMFDGLLLLSRGHQIYFGPASMAPDFFATKLNRPVPPNTNPSDWYLDQINSDFVEEGQDPAEKMKEVIEMSHTYHDGNIKNKIVEKIDHSVNESKDVPLSVSSMHRFNTGFFYQTWVLIERTLLAWLRNPAVIWARVLMYLMMALLMGTLYLQIGEDQDNISDRISILFFSVAFLCFMSISALPAFIEERIIFVRERMNSYYHVGAYSIANSLVSLPFQFLIAIVFTVAAYFMIGLQLSGDRLPYFAINLGFSLYVAEALVICISAVTESFIIGTAIAAAAFGMFMLVCGFFLLKSNIPGYWIWMHYMAFHKYAFEGFMMNEFSGLNFKCAAVQIMVELPKKLVPHHGVIDLPVLGYLPGKSGAIGNVVHSCQCNYPDLNGDCQLSGEEVLSFYEYDNVHKWAWLGVVIGMGLIFRFLFYFLLRFLNKGKR